MSLLRLTGEIGSVFNLTDSLAEFASIIQLAKDGKQHKIGHNSLIATITNATSLRKRWQLIRFRRILSEWHKVKGF